MKRNNKSSMPQFQTQFHVKEGSHLKKVDPSSMDWSGNKSCFFYTIAREEIEACDTTRLLHDLRPTPDNPLFKSGPGSVIFRVNGYDEDPRDLLQIPEFRAFASKVQQQAPCWLYYSMPVNGWLRIILAASTTDCRLVQSNGKLCVAITNSQVAKFMESQLKDFYELCEMAGIGGSCIDSHLYETMQDSFPELLDHPKN